MKVAELGKHVSFLSGYAFKSKFFNEDGLGLPVVRIRDVVRGNSQTFYSGEYEERYLVSHGDFLIGMDGEFNLAKWQSGRALLNQRVCKIGSISDAVDRHYLGRFLSIALKEIEDATPFVTVKHLSVKTLKNLQIPLPPLAEQKRIAAILDAADALRAKRRESLEQLDTLLQSIFLEMFGDPVTNPMEWGVAHLPDFVSKRKHSLKRGPFGGALKKEIFTSEGFKVYQQKNVIYDDFYTGSNYIGDSDFERLAAFMVRPRDLLISCSGTIGRIAAVPLDAEPGVMNQALLKLELDESKILNDFFLSLWRSRPFEQRVLGMTHGTGMKNMKSMKELKSIKFLQPPLDLQHRFATIVESIEQQKAAHRSHLEEIDTLFASLQQRAFQGEL